MIEIAKNVFVENSYPICNIGLIDTGDGLVMIDTPLFPADAVKWREAISKIGKLKYIINTEPHPDHCGNSCFFDAPLITQSITREILSKSSEFIAKMVKAADPGTPAELLARHRVRQADIVFDSDMTVHQGNLTIKLIHTPGHTAGNLAVYIPERKVLFASDNIIYHGKTWLQEAVPYQWLESLDKMGSLKIDAIVPGHSKDQPFCGKEYLKEEKTIVQAWIQSVESAIKDDLSLEEAIKTIGNPDPYHYFSGPGMTEEKLNRMIITRLYSVLKKN